MNPATRPPMRPDLAAEHLSPEHLAVVQRHLVAKALGELAHERLLAPEHRGGDDYRITSPDGRTTHDFSARRLALEHWVVEEDSILRCVDGRPACPDVQALVADHAEQLGLPDALLPTYLEELAATLASAAWKRHHHTATAADLLHATHQEIEAAMTEGHPAFVAGNGRIGFDVADQAAYSPEAGAPVHLVWVAARRALTHLSLGAGLTEEELYAAALDAATRARFDERLVGLGLDPDDYLLLPLHPWQWSHKVAVTFAPDVARRDLVLLGEGPDAHQAQQSIRTFADLDHPERPLVKTALAVQNMGFLRGLSPAYMRATPAINDWVHEVVAGDPSLAADGFTVLRERAAVGYTGDAYHAAYERAGGSGSAERTAYQKMVAALWRESPVGPRALVGDGERLATMASLLHRDAAGASLAVAMVEASPLTAREWVQAYLDAYLRPLVHCMTAHQLVFMPHGENLLLVLRDHVPVRVVMKDVGEEVAVFGDLPLPEEIERVRVDVPQREWAQSLHTDVLDGVLRFLAAVLHVDGVLDEDDFWAEARACVARHAADHPDLADAHAAWDLTRPEIDHSCLNRLQLRNTLQMVDLSDQTSSLMYAGTLPNPLAGHGADGLTGSP